VAVHPRGRRRADLADHVLHAAGAGLSLHPVAAGFARAADVYERTRPEYPPDAVAWLADRLELRPESVVVDVAAGTGKLTRLLVPSGARVVAVEPLPEMRAQLREAVPGVEALEGTAEAPPLPDACADAVTVAAAFHWFRRDEALAEFARVLRPGGRLAIVYNLRDPESELQQELSRMLELHGGNGSRGSVGSTPWPTSGRAVSSVHRSTPSSGTSSASTLTGWSSESPRSATSRCSRAGNARSSWPRCGSSASGGSPRSPFPYVTQIWLSRAG
jgi:protein-L-isoaspartate O-methyltransferase